MDVPSPTDVTYLAPGVGSASHALHLLGAMQPLDVPAVDERAVVPETGTEMIRGEVQRVSPAQPPHADRQCDVAYVIRAEVAKGYVASTELLTRVDSESDFATDACIRKIGCDPETGSRYLEEIAFEVKHTQSNADITDRARKLVRRGVRRVFVIPVKENAGGVLKAGPVKEWLAAEDRWLELGPDAEIVDPCLAQPVKVQALIDAAEANNQVARALLAQNNPVLVEALEARATELSEARARELSEAHARDMQAHVRELTEAHARQAILELCEVLAIDVTTERRARLDAMTGEELDVLRSAIRTQRRWPA